MTIMVQGAGLGFAFLPLQVLVFATLPPNTAPMVLRCSACSGISARRLACP